MAPCRLRRQPSWDFARRPARRHRKSDACKQVAGVSLDVFCMYCIRGRSAVLRAVFPLKLLGGRRAGRAFAREVLAREVLARQAGRRARSRPVSECSEACAQNYVLCSTTHVSSPAAGPGHRGYGRPGLTGPAARPKVFASEWARRTFWLRKGISRADVLYSMMAYTRMRKEGLWGWLGRVAGGRGYIELSGLGGL